MRIPNLKLPFARAMALAVLSFIPAAAFASSHMDAPLITLDPAANTADVYAFVSQLQTGTNTDTGAPTFTKYLTVALTVYPFEEPGEGPNNFRFDDNVLYTIHICKTNANNFRNKNNDLATGTKTITYQFKFNTQYQNRGTILNSFLGVVNDVGDTNQNMIQTYQVFKVDNKNGNSSTLLGSGIVPPNNQGIATPFYNQGDNGNNPARPGVTTTNELDRYTLESIAQLGGGYLAFAGQRDDGFYGDIQAIFDLLQFHTPGIDSQGGFNIHTIVLNIPVDDIGGDRQVVGVYASNFRRQLTVLRDGVNGNSTASGGYVQVARQGNPLFNELFVAVADKDRYNRTAPTVDKSTFAKYALNPEPAALFSSIVSTLPDNLLHDRTDLATIFIPDIIKVDLSTPPARLAGGGDNDADDTGFSRLSIFGNDILFSTLQTNVNGGIVAGGWPNGRRFGDDVVDIALTSLVSDLRTNGTGQISVIGDNVDHNDVPFNKVFPYAPTPNNGRIHGHHGVAP
ncbi:DUF4331 domain-containing protein [Pedosphaera parvula]|uniref:DUF4331 domain-containing protein n=1 Tax=Pedosphaera parvula (strain Ellin514) TaxID=320771 RepID=B9XQX2_PEDPL|nr:DUF4331 domain-containing protein [Pedosphaera parvula]EEF57749.1 conserved hypothetical protein [Pedosphaera parvula Ellin514]